MSNLMFQLLSAGQPPFVKKALIEQETDATCHRQVLVLDRVFRFPGFDSLNKKAWGVDTLGMQTIILF